MQPLHDYWFNINRRQLLKGAAAGGMAFLGSTALQQLMAAETAPASPPAPSPAPGKPTLPHFAPKAKRVIYLYQEGAPSQLDTLDYKPGLQAQFDKDLPASVRGTAPHRNDQRPGAVPIAPSQFKFTRYDNALDGLWVSDLLPNTGRVANELCVVKSMFTEQINHGPGVTFMQTGHPLPGRPAIGAWLSYGLGNLNTDLPSFVVMISQGAGRCRRSSHTCGALAFSPASTRACSSVPPATPCSS